MNARDVLHYGQHTLLGSLSMVPDDYLDLPGACGVWSIRDIVAHLASYELVLVDVLASAENDVPTPMLDRFQSQGEAFNDSEVDLRQDRSTADLLVEIEGAHQRVMDLVTALDPTLLSQVGTIPWYGTPYSLDDLIVYQYYGHKREHSAQIEAFRDARSREA